jgi:hypothetical protein
MRALVLIVACTAAGAAYSADPQAFLDAYAAQAQAADPGFSGFSEERGRAFYYKKHPVEDLGMVSCATCHHADPLKATVAHQDQIPCRACHVTFSRQPQSHRPIKREIAPFAPAGNPNRFTNEWAVEYWFGYNCKMLLRRDCTPQEKGDVIMWLLSVQPAASSQ